MSQVRYFIRGNDGVAVGMPEGFPCPYASDPAWKEVSSDEYTAFIRGETGVRDSEVAAAIRALPGDPEGDHTQADKILCQLLRELGYTDTVAAFEELEKWYA